MVAIPIASHCAACQNPRQSHFTGLGLGALGRICLVVVTSCLISTGAQAQDATWLASPGSGDFNTGTNWTPATVPTGTATFGTSNTTSITFSNTSTTIVGSFQFNAGVPAYTFTLTGTSSLEFNGTGVVNNSSNSPTFSVTSNAGGLLFASGTAGNAIVNNTTTGFTEFGFSSTAGMASISNNGTDSITFFTNSSTAGTASITNTADGITQFSNSSSAGAASITNGDGVTNGAGAAALFDNTSTAGTATITTNLGGFTEFNDSSTAGNATVITNSGGITVFQQTGSGGQAVFITNSGGIVDFSHLTSTGTTAGSIAGAGNYNLGSINLTVGSSNLNTEVSGVIADGGFFGGSGASLTKVGTGTLTLSGANTYTGGTTISAGTLQIGDGGTTGSIVGNVTNNATLAFDRSDNALILGGVISGTGALVQLGTGTTTLTGTNTYTGGTTISAGTLQIGGGGTTGSIAGNVTDNGTLAFDRSDTVTFNGVISGTGGLTQLGSGTLILTSNNPFTGTTTISAGTLQLGNGGASGGVNSILIVDNGILDIDRSDTITYGGSVTGTGSGVKDGAGTLIFTGNNTYTGGTTINEGALQIGNGGGTGSIVGNVLINAAGATLIFDRSDFFTLNGSITGIGGVTLESGTITLGGDNTYSGATNLTAGALQAGSATAFSANSAFTVTGTLDLNGFNNTIGSLSGTGVVTNTSAGPAVLTVGGDNTSTTFGGLLTDGASSLGLTKSGSGTLTLTGVSAYHGATDIASGILRAGSATAFSANSAYTVTGTLDLNGFSNTIGSLSGSGTVTNNGAGPAVLTAGGDNTSTTFSGVLTDGSGSLGLAKSGAGTMILTGANTYTGGTTIDAGTLQIGDGEATGSIVGNVTDNGTLAFDRSDTVTFDGVISGTGGLTQLGSGTLILTSNNPFTGTTTISAGTLQLGNGGPSGAVNSVLIVDNGILDIDRSDTITYGGSVTGTGSGVKDGAGTLIFTGNNTYTGGTTINEGALQIGNGGGTGSIVGNVLINAAGATLIFDRSDSLTLNGSITGLGGVTLESGTITLGGDNTYSGATNLTAGALRAGSATAFSANSAFTVTGTLDLNGFNNTIGSLSGTGVVTNTSAGPAVLTVGGDNTSTTFSGSFLAAGSSLGLTKIGSGTLTLTGASAYNGATDIAAGTLQAGSASAFTAESAYTVTGTLDLNGFSNTIGSLSGSGTVTNNGAGPAVLTAGGDNTSTTFSGVLTDGSGSLGLAKSGAGTMILTGANTYTGGTTIDAGTLQIGDGEATGSIVGNVTDNGTLAFDRSDTVTFDGVISGTGGLTQLGSGTLILTSNNPFTGTTTISAGTLQLGNGEPSGAVNSVLIVDNGILDIDRSDTITYGGSVIGTGSGVKDGAGTLIFTGSNTYTGGTTINEGALQIGNGGGTGSIVGNVLINAPGAALVFDRSGTFTLNGSITGTGTVTQEGTGVVVLGGDNTYSGATSVSDGTLQAGSSTALSASSAFTVTAPAILDLNGFNNTIGSLAGSGLVTNNGAGAVVLTVGADGTDTLFSGVLADGSGTLGLIKTGTGTTALTGTNTYSGGTTITSGTLQLGNGGTTGTVAGNVVDNGTLLFDRSNTLTFGGVISGSGSVQQNGTGTTTLSGTNTYTGGTTVNAGTLTVNNPQALGFGSVIVNGGILRADPQPINVKGNYTQNAGGTLQLQVAGAGTGQYDTLNVGGNASLNGTLQLISLGFQPKPGNELTLVTTGGTVTGRFATFLNPFTPGDGIKTIDLVYGRDFVDLEFLAVPPPIIPPINPPAPPPVIVTIDFESFAQTPNQRAAGNLLDETQLNPKIGELISFLSKEPVSNLPGDLEKISPDSLSSFYEISFSNANLQRMNLESRLDDLRNGSSGFSSNMKTNGASVNLEDKEPVDGKSSKNPVEQALQPGAENRWGVWVTGFGDFVNVDADYNAKGYDFTTGGASLGIDYRLTDQLVVGVMGEYSHTWTSLNPRGNIDVDSGRGGVYASWFDRGFYLNGGIYGGHSVYDSSRSTIGGMASGGTSGAEYSSFLSGGYDLHCGHLSVGPTASLQYTYVNIDDFTEKGSLAPLDIHSQSAESLRTDLGFRVSYAWQIGSVVLEPALRAAWEHEFKYSALPIAAGFVGIPGPSDTFVGPVEGHDSAIVSAGITAYWTPAISTYVSYDGQLGRDHYDSNAVTGGVRFSF